MADPGRPPAHPAAVDPPPLTLAIREHHPTDPRWRGDLQQQSTHGRLPLPPTPETAGWLAALPASGEVDTAGTASTADGTSAAGSAGTANAAGAAARHGRAGGAEISSGQADAYCAESARELLGDFAPGLLLLPATERTRVRTLAVYARTLIDCAQRLGPDGERLAAIDRWEAALERALEAAAAGLGAKGGKSGRRALAAAVAAAAQDESAGTDGDRSGNAGQASTASQAGDPTAVPPICRRMAGENARRRWPAGALDELAACARRLALRPGPASAAEAESEARSLAHAVARALLEDRLNAEVNSFVGALIRLRALQDLGRAAARGRSPLPRDEADAPTAIARECARLRPRLLRAPRGLVELPATYRRAGVYALLAALRLLSEIEEAGPRLPQAPPHLGTVTRIGLLLRARWFGLRAGLG